MRVSLSDGWIVVEVGSKPTAPQVRALRWLEDDGVLHLEAAGSNVRFPARAWLDAGELPPVTASSEETDEWQRRHDEIGRLLNRKGQSVYVDAIGPLGGAGFKLQLTVDEQRLDTGVSAPVVNEVVLLPAVYKALADLEATRGSWARGDQIAALGRLKVQLTESAQLLEGSSVPLSVTLHSHIADIEIRSVKRAALAWKSSSGSRLLSLELDEVREDESRERLPVEILSPDAPVISISAKEHLLLPDEIAEVARVARRNRNLLPRNVERDPTRLLPQGFAYDSIDLSDYGERVLGFEALHGRDSMPAPAAGVEWYSKDDQGGIPHVRLVLHDASGARHEREIPEADAPRLLSEAQTALESGGEIAIGGQSFPVRPEVVEQLREHVQRAGLQDGTHPAKEPRPDAPTRARQLAAVIDEHEGGGSAIEPIPEVGVPWPELDLLLRPEIVLRDHQRQGIEWLWRHYRAERRGVLLADEMGLGKTLQVGCFLALQAACGQELDRKLSTLIVCPKVLIGNWITEMDRYFRPGAVPRTRELHRDWLRRGDADLLDNGPSNFFVTSYDTFARYQQELLRRTWATAVLDESQNIKNPDTYRTRAARGLKRTFAICATGTPVENRFRDLWTQFDFLSPGAPFGTAKEFCAAFESGEQTKNLRVVGGFLDYAC